MQLEKSDKHWLCRYPPFKSVLLHQGALCVLAFVYSLFPPHDLCCLRSYRFLDIIRVDIIKPKILPATTHSEMSYRAVDILVTKHQLKLLQCTYSVGFLFSSTYLVLLAAGSLIDFPLFFFCFEAAGCRVSKAEGSFKFTPASLGRLLGANLCFWFFSESGRVETASFLETLFKVLVLFFKKTPFCLGVTGLLFSS